MKIRQRMWQILEAARPGDTASRVFDVLMLVLIALNTLAVMLGTVDSLQSRWERPLFIFEVFSVVVFTLEYVARVWSCGTDCRFSNGAKGVIRFLRQPLSVIDLVAILPFYLPFVGLDLRFIRALRLFRIVRLAKAGRYYSSLSLIVDTLRARKEELVLAFVILLLLLVLSASGIYYCEHSAQPNQFGSIPAALWWSVVTLTTVGYGDVFPVTIGGRVFASAVAIVGIGMFALPTGILGAGFVEEIRKRRTSGMSKCCPHCGKDLQ